MDGFIAGSAKPADGAAVCALMRKVSGMEPRMWGPTIVGFGEREYELAGGKNGPHVRHGLLAAQAALVFYISHAEGWDERLARLGKHRPAGAASTSTSSPTWTGRAGGAGHRGLERGAR